MTKTFDAIAADLAHQLRAQARGFLTLSKEQLRQRFQIGRLTANQSDEVVEALAGVDLVCAPAPAEASQSLRIYDVRHPIGAAAQCVAWPDESTDAPLQELADLVSRNQAGRELRSDDVPWLEALHMWLQLILGHEPTGWEDLRNDRHTSELTRVLGGALRLDADLVDNPRLIRLAALVDTYRPLERPFTEGELVLDAQLAAGGSTLFDAVESIQRRMSEQHSQLLAIAARVVLRGAEIPNRQVEVGLLGLRRRRERTV